MKLKRYTELKKLIITRRNPAQSCHVRREQACRQSPFYPYLSNKLH